MFDELKVCIKLEPKKGETATEFAERLVRGADKLPDDDWEALDDDIQEWVSLSAASIKAGKPLTLPEGIEVDFPDVEGGEEGEADAEEAPPPKKPVKAAKPKAKPVPRKRFETSDKITIVVERNPYREGTHSYGWFTVYKSGMTVAEAIEAGAPRHHIRWDFSKGNIKIAP